MPITATDVRDQVISWRRHLHRHPELSFHETNTSRFVAETLGGFGGLEISRPSATSVMARLKGGRPGRTLAMRADIDALPIHEKNAHDFVSSSPGVMHACGHDGHTAMLLGAAKVLAARRAELAGEIRFIFQHAEEIPPGGAEELVRAGVMEGVDLVIGAHLWSPLQVGKVGVKAGALMAAPDAFTITILGSGGHAALPQQTVDSIAVAAQVVTNLQHVVARNVDPLASAVLSVTRIAGGGDAYNVIPGRVELGGTVRTFDETLRAEMPRLIERIVSGVTSAHGARFEMTYERGYRPVINDAGAADLLRRAVVAALGSDALVEATPTMGGEDFSAYQQKAPGAFFFVGARCEESGIVNPHHHECFDVDERALDYGTRIFVAAAEAWR
ncbi:MAG: amidohydrolase [Gemmatimonadaceae bacterium]|nr:amidohydrolase [Gemmatimonadaceae bacterium]NUQ91844.1 amidohydrolase [Gemmatimonadaceae bacterium]NUR18155.1 amidohydrolase [Gemmatimonadaceae bacterium]